MPPRRQARFAAVYTVALVIGAVPVVLGFEPIQVTTVSLAATALTLPIAVVPFLFVINDESCLREHTNGWLSNAVVIAIIGWRSCWSLPRSRSRSSGADMDLVHGGLDAQLIDRDGAKMGRIDSIVVSLVDGEPPTVVAIECGPVPLAARIHPRLAASVGRWLRRRSSVLTTPYRIPVKAGVVGAHARRQRLARRRRRGRHAGVGERALVARALPWSHPRNLTWPRARFASSNC